MERPLAPTENFRSSYLSVRGSTVTPTSTRLAPWDHRAPCVCRPIGVEPVAPVL